VTRLGGLAVAAGLRCGVLLLPQPLLLPPLSLQLQLRLFREQPVGMKRKETKWQEKGNRHQSERIEEVKE
jgi:hypothetical protein